MNALNSFHSPTKFSQPANLTSDYLHNLIFVQSTGRSRSSSVVTLARPSVSSSLQITNCSFRYASPFLWNWLSSSFRQLHCVHSPPGSFHPACIISSQSPPSFSPSVTPSTFHSRLKTYLFHKFFPSSIVFLVPFWLPSRFLDLDRTKWALTCVCFSFFCFTFFFFLVTCAGLSCTLGFLVHVKLVHLIVSSLKYCLTDKVVGKCFDAIASNIGHGCMSFD